MQIVVEESGSASFPLHISTISTISTITIVAGVMQLPVVTSRSSNGWSVARFPEANPNAVRFDDVAEVANEKG